MAPMPSNRNLWTVFASLTALSVLSACRALGGPSLEQAAGTPLAVEVTVAGKAELVICTTQEPDRLFGDPAADLIWQLVGEPAYGSDGAFGAQARALAELPTPESGDLVRNPDGTLAVTLRYRDDLVWSDEQPFSAEDALLGIQAAAPPEVLAAEVAGEHTLALTLARDAGYPYVPDAPPLPSHVLGGVEAAEIPGGAYAQRVDPALGPYVMQDWTRGASMTLASNPHYAGGPPPFPRLLVRFVPDGATLVGDLMAGRCDVAAEGLTDADLPALQNGAQSGQAAVVAGPGALLEHVSLNTTPTGARPPYFGDTRVRQAVAYATNRAAMAESLGLGFVPPLESWLPPSHWAAAGDETALVRYGYDPARASALLSEAGWRDGNGDGVLEYGGAGGEFSCLRGTWDIEEGTPFAVTLLTSAGDDLRAAIASQLQADLQAVGIRLTVETLPPAQLFSPDGPLARRDFDAALFALPVAPEPGGVNWWLGADLYEHPLTQEVVHDWQLDERFERPSVELLAPTNIPSPSNDYRGQNLTGWCDEAANLAIYDSTHALGLPLRQATYAQQQALFSQQVPAVPLFQRVRVVAHRPDVCGIAPGPFAPVTWNVTEWRFDAAGACPG